MKRWCGCGWRSSVVTGCHECELSYKTIASIAELQRSGRLRVVGFEACLQGIGVQNDRLEVSDTNDNVQACLDAEFFEVGRVDGNCCNEWVFEYLLAVRDLFGITLEHTTAIFSCEDVKQFSLRAEVFDVLSDCTRMHTPSVPRDALVEQRMHNVYGFVGQPVRLGDPLVAHHLDDESTVSIVVLVL